MPHVKLNYNLDIGPESVWLTVTASQAARASIAYVQELGDFYCGADYFTSRENLPSYLMKLCISGKGILEYENERYEISPGHVFWIDCSKPQHYYTAPDSEEWHILWVHFSGLPCDAYYHLFLTQNEGKNVILLESDVTVRSTLEMLMSLYHNGGNTLQDDVQASMLVTQLMSHCINTANAYKGTDRLPGYVAEARNYINSHYAERITLDDLAHSISVNKFYLQKLFKRHIGLSPNEYLIYTRLTQAKRLLRITSMPINQIATAVGIRNMGHFTTMFRRYEGITPTAYRQRWYSTMASAKTTTVTQIFSGIPSSEPRPRTLR